MAKGIMAGSENRFFWNLDANVGPGCPNKLEDVHLVQLAFFCKANNPKYPVTPEEKAAYSAVVVGAYYNGAPNDPLSIAIKTLQKVKGGIQDGRISSIKSSSGMYAEDHTWLLVPLNNNMSDALGVDWPLLDRHPKCTLELAKRTAKTFNRPA